MKNLLFLMIDLRGGGAERALVELLQSIDYKKNRVSLCLMFSRGVFLKDIPPEVNIIRLFKKENSLLCLLAFGFLKRFNNKWLFSLLLNVKTGRKYDAIISFMEGLPLFLHKFIVNKGGVNIAWVHCDLYNYHYTKQGFGKYYSEFDCYNRMDRVVFVSQQACDNFGKLYNINAVKYCLYNVVNVDKIIKLTEVKIIDRSLFTITAIGSLNSVKGFDRLIRVAKKLKDAGYSFSVQIIGEGVCKEELLNLRDELGLHQEVSLLGFIPSPYSYLKHSDLFVSTSLSEGLPYVICEALALGVPIVSTKTAGAMELIGNSEYGILTQHDDNSIYDGIKRMMDNSELRLEYGKKGLAHSEIFSIDKTMKAFYKLIDC